VALLRAISRAPGRGADNRRLEALVGVRDLQVLVARRAYIED